MITTILVCLGAFALCIVILRYVVIASEDRKYRKAVRFYQDRFPGDGEEEIERLNREYRKGVKDE